MKLPRVYANPINKKLNNFQDMYRSDDRNVKYNIKEINKKINEIFGSLNHVYKSKVRITMDNRVIEKELIGKTNTSLLTLDGEAIKITDITNIEKI